jgi:methylthioribose-1-phosphate isomerase
MAEIRTLFWQGGNVVLLDQRALPLEERQVVCTEYRQVIAAIKDLTVRGAPAIGVAAALGIALGTSQIQATDTDTFRKSFEAICTEFAAARPTARNLFWAIERMQSCFERASAALQEEGGGAVASEPVRTASGISFATMLLGRREPPQRLEDDRWTPLRETLIAEALQIGEEDVAINRQLGIHGGELISDGARILTHCNAGALATAGYGTALGVIRAAREAGKLVHVWVDETRPVLQGARLTAWELSREGIPCTLITDNMAGFLMKQGRVDLVLTGADRIAANGDTANKIGTYALAVLAKAHEIPFYLAAPLSTIDLSLADGGSIPIEERDPKEVTHCGGVQITPEGVPVYNPAFDLTPHELITAIVTEAGILRPPFALGIAGKRR